MNLKIVHIITSLDVGGCEKVLFNLLSFDKSQKTRTLVISLNLKGYYRKKLIESGFEVLSLNLKEKKFLSIFLFIKSIINFKPDIIQGWMYHGNLFALFAKFLLFKKTNLFWNIRQTLYDVNLEKSSTKFVIFICKIFSKFPTKILANSRVSILQHIKYGYADNFQLIINGVDINNFKIDNNLGSLFRKKFGINENADCIGLIARYHPMKDHNFFIENILKVVTNNNIVPVIVGKDIVKQKNKIFQLVPNELVSKFILVDEYEDINEVLNSLNLICITSRWGEGMSNILIEAMSTGLNCISSKIGDNKHLINNFGSTYTVGDEITFVSLLNKHISKATDYKKRSMDTRNHIIKNYSLTLMFQKYFEIYNSTNQIDDQ
jgi:glycosyltransferase involved in cell wall biosynthesis